MTDLLMFWIALGGSQYAFLGVARWWDATRWPDLSIPRRQAFAEGAGLVIGYSMWLGLLLYVFLLRE